MSNLVPEKRQDINGKIVTRHVRSSGTAPGTNRIPAPQNNVRDAGLDAALIELADSKDRAGFSDEVKKTAPKVVSTLVGFLSSRQGKMSRELADHAIKVVSAKTKEKQRYVDLLRENYDYACTVAGNDEGAIALVNGIIDIEDRVMKRPLTEDERQALICVTSVINQSPDYDPMKDIEYRLRNDLYHYVMMDEELVRFTVGNVDLKEGIASAVASGVKRPGEIKAVLDGDVQRPLLDGAL